MSTMGNAKLLHLRLFLEGMEIPVVSAQIGINTNAPASAAIQVVPLDEAMQLKPRTMVHLFFLDTKTKVDEKQQKQFGITGNYRLLYSGEVVGFTFIKQPNSRAVVLQCLDFSSYWDSAHATAIEYGPFGNAFTHQGALNGSDTSHFDDIVNHQAERLVGWIRSPPKTPGLASVSGLAGGIIHMMEAMGGVWPNSKGINDFFTVAELRCRLLNQICAEEGDNTAWKLLNEKVFMQWLKNGLQNIGQQVTFRDMMKLLFQYIYYEAVPNPTAKLDHVKAGKTVTSAGTTAPLRAHPKVRMVYGDIQDSSRILSTNAIDYDPLSAAFKVTVDYHKKQLQNAASELKKLASSNPKASADLTKASNEVLKAANALDTIQKDLNPEAEGAKELRAKYFANIQTFLSNALKILDESKSAVTAGGGSTSTTATSARLKTQIIRPDCWFAAPPRCNVIFPEQYLSLSYDRVYLSEVTRTLVAVYNALVGPDALFADYTLAPSIGSASTVLSKAAGSTLGYRMLMDHELHTGIIPRVEWLSNTSAIGATAGENEKTKIKGYRNTWAGRIALFHFFKYRFGPRQASVAGHFNPYVVCGFPAAVITKPYILPTEKQKEVAGVSDADLVRKLSENSKDYGAPSHLVGMVAGINHNVSQEGGSTTIQMHHTRFHLGIDDDFLNLYAERLGSKRSRRISYVLDFNEINRMTGSTEVKAELLKLMSELTPSATANSKTKKQNKASVSKKQVQQTKKSNDPRAGVGSSTQTKTYNSSEEKAAGAEAKVAPALTRYATIPDITTEEVLVPSPDPTKKVGDAGRYGTIKGIQVADASVEDASWTMGKGKKAKASSGKVYRRIVVFEDVQLRVAERIPVENILRPDWFSKHYANEAIGEKIYQPFFGCDSVIDDLKVTNAGGKNISTINDSSRDVKPVLDIKQITKQLADEESWRATFSIERSLNLLGYVYGLVRSNNQDTADFIRSYIDRPIATLEEVLGGKDSKLKSGADGKVQVPADVEIGFHGMSVNTSLIEQKNLAGLVYDPNLQVARMNNVGKPGSVPPQYDVRWEKLDRVKAYVVALQRRAHLG